MKSSEKRELLPALEPEVRILNGTEFLLMGGSTFIPALASTHFSKNIVWGFYPLMNFGNHVALGFPQTREKSVAVGHRNHVECGILLTPCEEKWCTTCRAPDRERRDLGQQSWVSDFLEIESVESWTCSEALSGGKASLNSAAGDGTSHQTHTGNGSFWSRARKT